jgi:transcription termination factor Rho
MFGFLGILLFLLATAGTLALLALAFLRFYRELGGGVEEWFPTEVGAALTLLITILGFALGFPRVALAVGLLAVTLVVVSVAPRINGYGHARAAGMLRAQMSREELADKHLADLHAIAAELDVPGFRMLRRDDLIDSILERSDQELTEVEESVEDAEAGEAEEVEEVEEDEESAAATEEPPKREWGRGRRSRQDKDREEAETEPITGVLDVMPQRYGFLRLSGLEPTDGDVYISASQIRRCELRPGDDVSGPARPPRRGERHHALVHVDLVNGAEPGEEGIERPAFDELTPVAPNRRVRLDVDSADVLTRAVDLLVPLGLGQRVLVASAPRSGRTTLLRGLASAIATADDASPLVVLLIDERPEEATAWREALPDGAEVAIATAEMEPVEQTRVAELALERVKRRVEGGDDVVLIVDSLSRLGVAYGDAAEVKHLFGAGRELSEEDSGSLTVIATALDGSGEDDGAAFSAVATTENALITLDPELAAAGVFPALRPDECRASGEEELREAEELEAVRKLRDELTGKEPREAAEILRERIEGSQSNEELLSDV